MNIAYNMDCLKAVEILSKNCEQIEKCECCSLFNLCANEFNHAPSKWEFFERGDTVEHSIQH